MTTMDAWRRATTFWPPADVPARLAPLVPHFRDDDVGIHIGPGWFELALACHDAVSYEFPEYELHVVKQKYARLAFHAFPWPRTPQHRWTSDALRRVDQLVAPILERSEAVCERCGQPGHERDSRPIYLTLCDACDEAVQLAGPDRAPLRPRSDP